MPGTHDARWTVRPPRAGDEPRWRELYAGYAAFYSIEQTDEMASLAWSWLLDPGHVVEGLVAVDEAGVIQGLAHFRAYPRPSAAALGGYLDDLFVDPAVRGAGAADALLEELRRVAGARGWTVVRWITAEDNRRARGVYDRHARRTGWVTYDMEPPAPLTP